MLFMHTSYQGQVRCEDVAAPLQPFYCSYYGIKNHAKSYHRITKM